jgi:hypothetical protein
MICVKSGIKIKFFKFSENFQRMVLTFDIFCVTSTNQLFRCAATPLLHGENVNYTSNG